MTKSQIGIGCVGLLAAGLFLAGLFLPIAVVGFPNGGAGIALWESTWCRATLLVFLALVALPLVKPGSHAWVLSFLAAAALIAMASGGLLKHWFGADSLIPITLLVLLSAGICLAAEAILAPFGSCSPHHGERAARLGHAPVAHDSAGQRPPVSSGV